MEKEEDNVDIADIQAGVDKTRSRLFFTGVVLFMCLVGFSVKTCASYNASRPPDPIPSVECIKIGGKWIKNEFKSVNDRVWEIEAYCDAIPKPATSQ